MTDFRKILDVTPWDKSGSSFMGLTRNQAKWLGLIFLFVGFNLADFVTPLPNDVLNFWVAAKLFAQWPSTSYATWLIFTYTVFAWGLILLGAWIYPRNTHSVLNGYVNQFQTLLRKVITNPLLLVAGLISLYLMYRWFNTHLAPAP